MMKRLTVVLICVLWGILILTGCGSGKGTVVMETVPEEQDGVKQIDAIEENNVIDELDRAPKETREAGQTMSEGKEERTEQAKSDRIFVDISGAVIRPGVYELTPGSRVYEAVEKAGGLSDSADENFLNQALMLEDGQKIRVYTVQETSELNLGTGSALGEQGVPVDTVLAGGADDGLVNLNQADAATLMTLPGIGESKAADIIAYREEHNGFQNIEEIKNISGIKDAVFSKIKDKIAV